MKPVSQRSNPTPQLQPQSQNEGRWKRDLAVGVTTVAATAAGTYAGAELGMHFLSDHIATATQGHGLWALLTVPVEALRGMITHVAPWAVGTGTASGALAYAVGRAATQGAPLTDDSAPEATKTVA